MIYFKRHRTDNGDMIAMCDAELIDKVLHDGALEVDIKGYSSFYKGELLSAKDAKERIVLDDIFSANVVGSESIGVAMGSSLIEKEHVLKIKNVPYAQAFRVKR